MLLCKDTVILIKVCIINERTGGTVKTLDTVKHGCLNYVTGHNFISVILAVCLLNIFNITYFYCSYSCFYIILHGVKHYECPKCIKYTL